MKEEVEILKQAFYDQKIPIVDCEKMLKQKLTLRHNQQLIKTICTQLSKELPQKVEIKPVEKEKSEFDFNNFSSATSTPINCKS